jgi:hypothetical protein
MINSPDTIAYLLAGQQQVAKFRETSTTSLNTVDIFLAVIRLPQVNTDILITVNVPVLIGSTSSSRQMLSDNIAEPSSDVDGITPLQTGNIQLGELHVRSLLSSFAIKDWELFQ